MKTFYTNAPENYDGFSTKRTGEIVEVIFGKVEKIYIEDRDIEWQSARYSSGMKAMIPENEIEKYK